MLFFLESLSMSQKSVHLQCVFHSIRFKVNKGWSTAVLLFYAHTFRIFPLFPYKKTYSLGETPFIFLKTRLK